MESQIKAFQNIQMYVLLTILVLLLQLGHLLRPFAFGFFRSMSWISYMLVPVLISYILGLMSRFNGTNDSPVSSPSVPAPSSFPAPSDAYIGSLEEHVVGTFRYLTCVWVIFLMFAYAGFDNLNAFSLEERHGRSKLVMQIAIQFSLLLLILKQIPSDLNLVPILWAIAILACKFVGRLFALAHSAGETLRIKKDVARLINYANRQDVDVASVNLDTMEGLGYLVGPKYSNLKKEGKKLVMVDGITLEKIWGVEWRLLVSSNMELKDTCLSFALFWLLLGKFWSYPLYSSKPGCFKSSRAKAWKLFRRGLLAVEGEHERVFRVIEIELAFLRDYFHAKYIFFYLNGFYWKLISVVAMPIMFWWFIKKTIDHKAFKDLSELNELKVADFDFSFTQVANEIVISVIVTLEAMQMVVLLTSRWLKVTLYCLYVKKKASKKTSCLTLIFLEALAFIFLGLARSSNRAWWRKPWKRELDQYSLVKSCTTFFNSSNYLKLHFSSVVGIPLSKPGRKLGKSVKLSEEVKKAVVLCLQRNDAYPKLSNGAQSLIRNRVEEWNQNLNNDTETILVWHIATSVCEFHHDTINSSSTKSAQDNMKVAQDLSKYCAYLLFFAPSLLSVPSLESESICNAVIKEARKHFKKNIFGVSSQMYFNDLMTLVGDEEDGRCGNSVLRKGAKLGNRLVTRIQDIEKRWKILAEFWVEMILYLAPSNNNEMEHATKLSQGGEFITQLWALLIHAGIANRDDMTAALQDEGDA